MKDPHYRCWASFHGGHSQYGDGRGTVDKIAQMAAQRDFRSYGFSEHFTTPPHNAFSPDGVVTDLQLRSEWLKEYVTAVQAAKARFADQMSILLGTEFEYIRGAESWTREQLSQWSFDYLVGSVHYVRFGEDDICIDWDRPRIEEALRRAGSAERLQLAYYDHVLELLDWRRAHVIAHLDLIKMNLHPQEQVLTPGIRSKVQTVLETIRDRGLAMDVNARGLIKPCRAIYPGDWILEQASRMGVLPTLGDDSHGPDEVGARLDKVVAALRRSGFDRMAIVHAGGALEPVPLPPAGVSQSNSEGS